MNTGGFMQAGEATGIVLAFMWVVGMYMFVVALCQFVYSQLDMSEIEKKNFLKKIF